MWNHIQYVMMYWPCFYSGPPKRRWLWPPISR